MFAKLATERLRDREERQKENEEFSAMLADVRERHRKGLPLWP